MPSPATPTLGATAASTSINPSGAGGLPEAAQHRLLGYDWRHVWGTVTPAEEVLQKLGDLVWAGKIRYSGFSDIPAWYVTKAAALAWAHVVRGPIAMQPEYSLVARRIEREYVPAAQDLGLGIMPWSPLAAGFLAGKYEKAGTGAASVQGWR
ncbi:aldo/keto reductase [Hymenobacter puniceus]|uniref:aldo/keto reductase n=1 Tax=Hymenobacter sp. BT190 TaxID=2763505 RepID=UPI002905AD49|nr:aldo/keto reductase [Hymenobacter sp. BT190]